MIVRPVPKRIREAFLVCHSEGHQWRHEGRLGGSDQDARPPLGITDAAGRLSICTSCGCERIRWYTRSGEVMNRYRHADGYLHRKESEDDAAPSKLEWRQRLVVSLFADLERSSRRSHRRAS